MTGSGHVELVVVGEIVVVVLDLVPAAVAHATHAIASEFVVAELARVLVVCSRGLAFGVAIASLEVCVRCGAGVSRTIGVLRFNDRIPYNVEVPARPSSIIDLAFIIFIIQIDCKDS